MSVPKAERIEEDIKWIWNFSFEIKLPRTLCEEWSFHSGSNRGIGGYGSGSGSGGEGDGVLIHQP